MAIEYKDVFKSTGQSITYRDVFSPAPPITTGPITGLIRDAWLTEDGQLYLAEDGLSYYALAVAVDIS